MKTEKRKIGDFGENIAVKYLHKNGYKIIDRNYQKQWGEIDVIGKKNGILYFFEVKTRSLKNIKHYLAEQSVNRVKMKKLQKICQTYLLENKRPLNQKWQIDVLAIYYNELSKKALVRHFENAIWEEIY